jgi:hypothetical protein
MTSLPTYVGLFTLLVEPAWRYVLAGVVVVVIDPGHARW